MDRNCVGWSLNSTGTLLVMTIYSKLDGRTIELWDVAKVKRIWKTYAVNLASTTFSPNGELLGIFISGSTLRYTDHPISMPSTVEIYNVRNSLVKQSQGRIFMDAGMYQQTSTDRTLPDSFTITNTGLQRAVSLCDSQDSGYHLQQTGVNKRPNSIHVLHSPSKCLLQYSEDGRRLYCVTTTEDSFASKLILRVWNTEEGTIEAICTNKLYGLPLTNDFGKMLHLAVFEGAHLVFLVRRQKIGQSGDVNCVVIINEGDLTAVYCDRHTLRFMFCRVDCLSILNAKRSATRRIPGAPMTYFSRLRRLSGIQHGKSLKISPVCLWKMIWCQLVCTEDI